MLPKKTRHYLYALLLIAISIVCTSAIANTSVYGIITEVTSGIEATLASIDFSMDKKETNEKFDGIDGIANTTAKTSNAFAPPMFMTIIQGADEEVVCPNDGSTLAKFFLCGTSDIRTLSLSQSGGSYRWEKLDAGSCTASVQDDCPNANPSCTWNLVSTSPTYNLDSSGEFRVRIGSGQFFYFKSTLNPLDPQLIKEDIVCGNPGRVEITNVPAGYEYSLDGTTYQDDPFFDITTPGDYQVFVRLRNVSASACVFPSNTVNVASLDISAEVNVNDILCSGELGSIDVSVFNVPGFYTYRLIKNGITVDTFGPNGSDAYSFLNVSPGTYTIRVETNKCSELITLDVGGNPIEIGAGITPLAASATASDSFGCGATSVAVNLETSGGSAPYRFSLDGGATFSTTYTATTTFNVSTPGNYPIVIEDANGCRRNAAVDVEDIPEPTYGIVTDDGNCGGANDGSVTFNVSNTNGYNITYSINGGSSFQVSNVFSNLAPNTYNVVIRYQQGAFSCDIVDTATVGTVSTITSTASSTAPTCLNETGGQIIINAPSGGTAPYEFSIGAGFGPGSTFSNLGVGSYTPLIRDANGCVQPLTPIVFDPLDKPTDLDFAISTVDCATGTATVTVTSTGGTGLPADYDYEIIAPGASAVNNGDNTVFPGLGLGTYTFRVTDGAGCSYDENFAITDISSISARAQQTRVVTCFGGNDGEGRFLIDGFNTTYSWSIDGGPVTTGESSGIIPLTGLTAGTYTITVEDEETNCPSNATLTIEEPSAALTIDNLVVTDMNCQNGNIGSVRVETSGGWGGNRYTLDQPAPAPDRGPRNGRTFTNLSTEGLYTVTVEDTNGCTVTGSFTLTALEAPVLTLNTTASDLCYDNNNAATLVVNEPTTGVGPFRYSINGGAFSAPTTGDFSFSGLTPNTYTIEVRDSQDCSDTLTQIVQPEIRGTATIIRELTCAGPDAQIRVVVNDGYPSGGNYDHYEVRFDTAPLTAQPYSSSNFTFTGNTFVYNVPAALVTTDTNFQFQIFDSQGCPTETNVVTLSPTEVIAGAAVGSDTVCGDLTSGTVTVNADTTQGVAPYEFSNDGGLTYSTQNVFSGYAPGTYADFRVRDSRGCESPILSATINPSTAVDATVVPNNAICTGATTFGSIDVTNVTNGTADFTYTLLDVNGTLVTSIGPTSSTAVNFPNIAQGTYTVVTTDASGCEDRDVVTIDQNQLTLTPLDFPTVACNDPAFTYRVQAAGGTAPYEFRLVGSPLGYVLANVNGTDIHDFVGQVEFGVTYFVEVRDANGCEYIQEIPPITGPSTINVNASANTLSCASNGAGVIDYTITGIASPANITIRLENTNTGAVVNTAGPLTGVTIPYSDSFTGLSAGNYQVIVTDDDTTCNDGTLVSIIEEGPALVVTNNEPALCPTVSGAGRNAFVTVSGNGGAPGYTYAYVLSTDPEPALAAYTTQTIYEISGPYPETYNFYIQDANGCISFTPVTVTEAPGVPTPTVDVVNQCTAVSNYTVNVTSPLNSASTAPEDVFQYDIGGGFQDSPNFTVPNPGSYTITVRDGNGCTNTVVAEVFDFFAISADATSLPTCNAGDGEITVNTTGGSGNFEFQLRSEVIATGITTDIGTPQTSNSFTGLNPNPVGERYNILVTDLSSNTLPLCTAVATVEVTTVVSPQITAAPMDDISCNGANDGSITVELAAGTDTDTPLSYFLYDSGGLVAGPQTSATFDNLGPETYEVEVISNRGCVSNRFAVGTIAEPSVLQMNTVNTEFTCDPSSNRFSTATITVFTDTNGDGSGTDTGTAPYSYSINDGTAAFDGTNFQTSNTFEIIDNGADQTIIVTVRDQNGCEQTSNVLLRVPTDLTFTLNVNPITCDPVDGTTANPGSVEVIVNQGTGDYDVELLPLGSGPVLQIRGGDRINYPIDTSGDYIFAVTEVGGCSYITNIVNVPEYNTIDAVIAETRPVTCFNGRDGEISITINNYTGAYDYEVFTRDNAGVETTTGVTGSFDTTAPINTPEIIGGLPAGNLIVRIDAQDTPFCDTFSNVETVRGPDRPLTVTPVQTSDVTCANPGLGEITLTGDGGWGAYEFQVIASDGTIVQDFPDTNNIVSGLDADTFTINVRDALGCTETNSIVLNPPTAISADIQIVNPLQCNNDNDGSIEVFNVVGGQGAGNYLYQLNRITEGTVSGLQTTTTFANLSAGEYSISVFDGWDCEFTTSSVTIQDPEIIIPELIELNPPGCGDLGLMELSVSNPELGVSYFFRRSGTTDAFVPFSTTDPLATSVQISADITVDPGPFIYDVQNSNGCPSESSNQISLDPAAPLVVALDLTNATINCAGEATGIIRSEAFGGIGNYIYTLVNNDLGSAANGGVPNMPIVGDIVPNGGPQSSGIFRNLGPGSYWVFAQSGGCIAISDPIVIEPKEPLVLEYLEAVPVSCNGETDGQIIIEASGGTGVIRYSISDTLSEFFEGDDPSNPNRKTFSNLSPRPSGYEIIIQDELGCTITQTVPILEPQELVAGIVDSTPEICLGEENGTVTLQVSGGTAPYFTSVNTNDDADFVRNDSMFFDSLRGGETYVIFVRDSRGCETNVVVPIEIGIDLVPEFDVQYGCDGIFPNSTVTVSVVDTSLMPDVLYALDPVDPTDAITAQADTQRTWGDLSPGMHTVYVYHQRGCAQFVEFEIDAYDPLTLTAEQTGPNELTATAEGGFGEYEFFFQGESTGDINTYNLNEDDNVTIRVIDARGCEATIQIPFNFTGMLDIPNFFTPDGDNNNDEWFPRNREFFPNIEVKIYDRYGRVVAILDQITSWDGTYEGSEVPTGDYWYVVNANDQDKQQYVGHFTLYR
ncbi:T9SS type B sorting domain-containing protein [Costertonia aggregata]|uniref:T9SS type B sorting domain-containing protein n=1 Tax=Costertonia aggregata TaxID=343403 RepID=A0A7H9AKQ5_9FLAO|nr:T9SS type B sorting domain-containing protein [Costertonia aggregata]QLG44061.1 T9SS type B sorting domain-containing protein [Costertonia aggregata]